MKPCGRCLAGEFADEDSNGLAYIAKPESRIAHVKRPSGSEGKRGWIQAIAWLGREGPHTYCGQPIGDDWVKVEV